MIDGLLIVDKQKGWTSYNVVAFLRKVLNQSKVGHAGTLDPLASGVLVIATGRAARTLDFLTAEDKLYETTIHLGKVSTTHDAEGIITDVSDRIPSLDEIYAALEQFQGEITQTPPLYSAIRVGGKRAYDLVRAGHSIEIPARNVEIKELVLLSYAYPYLTLRVRCSKGTYIRTLGSDIGETLGVGGYLSNLRRISSGLFTVGDAISLTKETPTEDIIEHMIPLEDIRLPFPVIMLSTLEAEEILHGRKLPCPAEFNEGELICLRSQEDKLLAVAKIRGGQICVYKNFM